MPVRADSTAASTSGTAARTGGQDALQLVQRHPGLVGRLEPLAQHGFHQPQHHFRRIGPRGRTAQNNADGFAVAVFEQKRFESLAEGGVFGFLFHQLQQPAWVRFGKGARQPGSSAAIAASRSRARFAWLVRVSAPAISAAASFTLPSSRSIRRSLSNGRNTARQVGDAQIGDAPHRCEGFRARADHRRQRRGRDPSRSAAPRSQETRKTVDPCPAGRIELPRAADQ